MKRGIIIAIVVIAALAAAGIAAKYAIHPRPGVNLDEVVINALSPDRSAGYVAEVVTTSDYSGRKLKTTATVYSDGSRQRIEYKGGAAYVVTNGDKTCTCLPGRDTMLLGSVSSRISSDAMAKLTLKNYRPVYEGKRAVAGRDAYVIKLVRRTGQGPAKKMWIDAEHDTILKSVDYAASGEPRAEMEVRRISYDRAIDPSRFDPPDDPALKVVTVTSPASTRDMSRELRIRVTEPTWLPRGYVLSDVSLFHCQCGCGHKSAQLVYTDGLNTISVFQTPAGGSCRATECGHGGHGCSMRESELARVAQTERPDKTVVVIADLVPDQVRKIVESVK